MSEAGQRIIRNLQDVIYGRVMRTQYRRCTKCWNGPKTYYGKCAECYGRGLVPIDDPLASKDNP